MPKARYRVKRHLVTQPLDQSYRLIPLTRNQNAIVDAVDFEWLNQWNWFAHWSPFTKSFYAVRWIPEGELSMHRAILECSANEEGDHIDGDTLNDRRGNLRKCTHAQNTCNKRKRETSEYIGVRKYTKNKWRVEVMCNGEKLVLSGFINPDDAAFIRDQLAKEVHGEFAKLN